MAEKFFSERNLRFTLYDVHDVASLAGSAYYADHGRETFDILQIGRASCRERV